jgi:ABC-type nitrate/sulfonate/bicarbonate transport system permease component
MAQLTDAAPQPAAGRVTAPRLPRLVAWIFSRDTAIRIATLVVIVFLWQRVASGTRPIVFPDLVRIFGKGLIGMIEDGRLLEAWLESIGLLVGSLAIATVTGVTLGIAFGRYRIMDEFFAPLLTALFMTPRVALVPLIALWLGYGTPGKLLLIFLFSFFEIFYTVRGGVRAIDSEYVEVARAYSVPERIMLWRVILPASLPYVVTGLRLGMLHGFVGLVLAGFFLENTGIGGLIFNEGTNFRSFALIAALFTVALVGVALNSSLHRLERRVAPWRTGAGA